MTTAIELDQRVKGIDVSDNNGVFNWAPWRGHIDFAAMKATEATDYLDKQFARNWETTKEMGVRRFAYHFLRPSLEANEPSAQARFFVERVRAVGLEHGDNFMADVEVTDGFDPQTVSFFAWTFCREVQRIAPGHRVVVYTFPAFAEAGNCAMLRERFLWVANWNVPLPEVPPPWGDSEPSETGWKLWQDAAGQGTSPDLDVFNGTRKDLDEFCTTTGM